MLFLEFRDTLDLDTNPVDSLLKILQVLNLKGYTKHTLDTFITVYNQIDSKTIREFCKDLNSIMFESVSTEILEWVNSND